jgi:hypothetical protein
MNHFDERLELVQGWVFGCITSDGEIVILDLLVGSFFLGRITFGKQGKVVVADEGMGSVSILVRVVAQEAVMNEAGNEIRDMEIGDRFFLCALGVLGG